MICFATKQLKEQSYLTIDYNFFSIEKSALEKWLTTNFACAGVFHTKWWFAGHLT